METSNKTQSDFFLTGEVSDSFKVSLRDRIKVLLRRKGISQNELSSLVGISKGTMSKIVSGYWTPTSQIMILIAKELDCDSAVIFGDKEYWKDWNSKIKYPEEKKNG